MNSEFRRRSFSISIIELEHEIFVQKIIQKSSIKFITYTITNLDDFIDINLKRFEANLISWGYIVISNSVVLTA